MALIDYKCEKCGKEFFEVVKEGDIIKCPSCGAVEVKRLYKGKFYGNCGSCSGSCGSCGGCGGH